MLNQAIMLCLTLSGLLVMYLLTHKNRWGWMLSLVNQVAWLALAYRLESWGFLLGALAFGAIAIRGWVKWKPPARPVQCPGYPPYSDAEYQGSH